MRKPTDDEMERAAMWLESYEEAPGDDSREVFARVAEWLREQARKAFMTQLARENGLTMKELAAAMRKHDADKRVTP